MSWGFLGAVMGAATWFAVVFAVSFGTKAISPDAAAALVAHATLAALAGRLAISFFGSLLGGFFATLIASDRGRTGLLSGVILLVVFVPYHMTIWQQFPIWYHLTFFMSLPLLSLAGGQLTSWQNRWRKTWAKSSISSK
jgi:hypothetical protein